MGLARPAPRCAANMVAMRLSISTSGMRMRAGGGIGHGLPGAAAERGANAVQNVVARHQRRLHISRKLRAGAGGRSRWLSQARRGPMFMGAGTLRIQPAVRRRHGSGQLPGHFVQPRMRHQPREGAERQLLQAVPVVARLGLFHVRAQLQQHLRNIDLHRADLGARAAQAGSEGQAGLVRDPHELRRDDGADGSRVDPRKTVAADLAVDRAGVQTGAAANAVERLALAAVGQQPRAAVIEQHHVEFVGPVDFAAAPRAAEETTCRR